MADNAKKAVIGGILDTWTRGPSIMGILDSVSSGLSNLGPVVRGGDSVDIPTAGASTVNTSESGAVSSSSIGTPDQLVVNRPKFINEAISQAQNAQLLNGNENFARQITSKAGGDMRNAIDKDLVDHLLTSTAYDAGGSYHVNVAADAITEADVNDAEALIREQDGIANSGSGLFWLVSPRAAGGIKSVAEFDSRGTHNVESLGIPMVGSVNGIPAFYQNAMPGRTDSLRQQVATSAVTVSSNVATATVSSGHGFVAGQQIFTTGLTTNIAKASPVAITSVTATEIVYPLTASDGALADGVGTVYSASAMAMLVYAPWVFYALDGEVPFSDMVKREGNAGFTMQMFHHLGRAAHSGACVILHGPD